MDKRYLNLCIAGLVLIGSACATAEPSQISCAADTSSAKFENAAKRIERDGRKQWRKLKTMSGSWDDNSRADTRKMTALIAALETLQTDMRTGRGMRALKTLAASCDNSEIVSRAFDDIFARQDLPESFQTSLKAAPIYAYWLTSDVKQWIPIAATVDVPLPRMEDF